MKNNISVLEYLKKMVDGKLNSGDFTFMNYPTNISKTLNMQIEKIALGEATISINADIDIHGNQQNTVHGGLMCELADQSIGTAHSTFINENESFASVDLKINFFAPFWKGKLFATSKIIRKGKTLTHYECKIL